MSFKVGDVSFVRNGEPTIVVGKDPVSKELTLSRDKKELEKNHRYGYVNGLQAEDRSSYLSLLDEVAGIKDPEEKVQKLRERISELEQDPKQFQLLSYLKSELFHVMHTYNVAPREYKVYQQF
jgi:hypothetical protein